MAEFENENQDLENQIEDLEDETGDDENHQEEHSKEELKILKDLGIDLETASVDDLKKVAKILAKTQKSLVDFKTGVKVPKKIKAQNALSNQDLDTLLERKLEVKEFYKNNPEASEFKELIDKELKENPKLSIQKAYKMVMLDNEELINNRAVYGDSLISGKQGGESFSVVNSDTYLNMSFRDRKEYEKKSQSKYGEVRFK